MRPGAGSWKTVRALHNQDIRNKIEKKTLSPFEKLRSRARESHNTADRPSRRNLPERHLRWLKNARDNNCFRDFCPVFDKGIGRERFRLGFSRKTREYMHPREKSQSWARRRGRTSQSGRRFNYLNSKLMTQNNIKLLTTFIFIFDSVAVHAVEKKSLLHERDDSKSSWRNDVQL